MKLFRSNCSVIIFSIHLNDKSFVNETTFNIICSNVLALLDGKAVKWYASEKQDTMEPPATSHSSSSAL